MKKYKRCLKFETHLSEKLIKKVKSLEPKLKKYAEWPAKLKKLITDEEYQEFYIDFQNWEEIGEKKKRFLEKVNKKYEKLIEIEKTLKILDK